MSLNNSGMNQSKLTSPPFHDTKILLITVCSSVVSVKDVYDQVSFTVFDILQDSLDNTEKLGHTILPNLLHSAVSL